jgi:putative sigma-54 modulation protein
MRVDVIGKQFEVTDAIRDYTEKKVAKLPRFYDGVQQITVRISKQDHANQGTYQVELVLDVERHDDFVSSAEGGDLYAIIDLAVAKGSRQLTDYKEKLKLGKR